MMTKLNKWIRLIHRWLVIPFLSVIVLLLAGMILNGSDFQLADWMNAIALGSLLLLFLSGLYLFAQHYVSKWRSSRRQVH
jgi:ABC-type nickel/cobalt efflux system permease component RcnA